MKRTAACESLSPTLAPTARQVLLRGLAVMLGLFAGLVISPAQTPPSLPSADVAELLLKSHNFVAGVASFEMEETKVEKMTPQVGGEPAAGSTQRTQSLVIRVVNSIPLLTELITKDAAGLPLRVIRRGDRVVMKLGDQPWQWPTATYLGLKDQLATPYACPLPPKGKDAPEWRFVASGQERGESCDIIETVGDSTIGYVTGVMKNAMTAADPNVAARPAVQVLSYVSRHWIAKSDAKRLRVEQVGHMRLSMPQPAGPRVEVDLETSGVTIYRRYGEVTIEIPDEAARLLATAAPKA